MLVVSSKREVYTGPEISDAPFEEMLAEREGGGISSLS